jgi:hypothetical protein
MFVVMAVVTTVTTSPLTRWLYPLSYRLKVEKWRRGEIDWDENPLQTEAQSSEHKMEEALDKSQTNRLILHLRLDALPGLFNLVSLLGGSRKQTAPAATHAINNASADATPGEEKTQVIPSRPFEVRGVRLMELTDRTSSVMQSAELDEFASRDAVFSAFQAFSRLNGVAVAGQVSIIPTNAYAETIVKFAEEARSDFMIIPWSTYGDIAEESSTAVLIETDNINERFFSRTYIDYVQNAIERSTCTTGIFINRIPHDALTRKPTLTRTRTGLSVHRAQDGAVVQLPVDQRQIIFVPFIGGKDDRAALLFALQLAHNPHVSIHVVHLHLSEDDHEALNASPDSDPSTGNDLGKNAVGFPSASDMDLLNTAKNNAAGKLEGRVTFVEISVNSVRNLPDLAVAHARELVGKSRFSVGDLIIAGRSHTLFDNLLVEDFGVERDFQRTIGVLGDRFARAGVDAGLLVIDDKQAKA